MSAPIYTGMASFADNFAKAYDRAKDRAGEENERKYRNELRDRQRAEWKDADALKFDLKSASSPVTMVETAGGMSKPDTMDNRDVGLPENAALPNAGLTPGAFMVGGQSFTDRDEAAKKVDAANAPEAVNSRVAQVYRSHGQLDKAASMESAALEMRLKKMGLSMEEAKFADFEVNRRLKAALESGPDWATGAASFLSKTQLGSLKGVDVVPRLSADGKVVQFVGAGPDGEKVIASFPNSEQGQSQFINRFMSMPLEGKVALVNEQARADLAARKVAADEKRAEAAETNAATQGRKMDFLIAGGGRNGAGGGAGGGSGSATPQGMPDPMAGFDPKKAYATAAEMAAKESEQAGKPATPQQIASRTTEIYRSLESEFQSSGMNNLGLQAFGRSARGAQTPQDLSALYQRGLAGGLTPDDMVAIDRRFAEVARAAKPATGGNQGAAPAAGVRQGAEGSPATPKVLATMGGGVSKSKEQELQEAYQAWQAAKPSWFSQRTPTSEAREREAEARYTELLRSQYQK